MPASSRAHSACGDDAGHEVERERPLLAGEGEGDAPVAVGAAQAVDAGGEVGGGLRSQGVVDAGVDLTRAPEAIEHLVVRRADVRLLIVLEQVGHCRGGYATCRFLAVPGL